MSGRPLELVRYHIWENGLDGTLYADRPGEQWPVRVGYEVLRKRLTDAELAAEYWFEFTDHCCEFGFKHEDRVEALERFATHPHHDEEV